MTPGRVVVGRIGDPTREGVGQPVPIILPDGPTLFARRAVRLDALAEGHPMADWLRFVARLARAQAAVRLRPTAQAMEIGRAHV